MTEAGSPGQRRFVVVLNHFATPLEAPGGTRHVELFSRLPGWDATIIAASRNLLSGKRSNSDDSIWSPVWVNRSSGGSSRVVSWAVFSLTALARGLSLRKPDVIYASSPHLLAGLSGLVMARARRAHFVFEVRDLWPQVLVDMGFTKEGSLLHRTMRALESALYMSAEMIVVLTPGVQHQLAERGFDDKVRLIPNCADPQDFDPGATKEELRRRYGLKGFVIVYAGAHGKANGLDLVLDAAGQTAAELPQTRFLLVGDGPMKQHLVDRATAEGLSNVTFLDPIPKREMPALLGAADAGLHVLADVPLFRYGVSPNKIFDYMAAGLPVLTNTPGEMTELIHRAGSGVAVEPNAIARGVDLLVASGPEQLARWGSAGRHFMLEGASRTAMAARLTQMLTEVAERPLPGRRRRTARSSHAWRADGGPREERLRRGEGRGR
jgi:glycosyltransferase involved in cell wall biosynthesis